VARTAAGAGAPGWNIFKRSGTHLSGFAVAYLTGTPWLGVLAAGGIGILPLIQPMSNKEHASTYRSGAYSHHSGGRTREEYAQKGAMFDDR
jgi:hypothetical protein